MRAYTLTHRERERESEGESERESERERERCTHAHTHKYCQSKSMTHAQRERESRERERDRERETHTHTKTNNKSMHVFHMHKRQGPDFSQAFPCFLCQRHSKKMSPKKKEAAKAMYTYIHTYTRHKLIYIPDTPVPDLGPWVPNVKGSALVEKDTFGCYVPAIKTNKKIRNGTRE